MPYIIQFELGIKFIVDIGTCCDKSAQLIEVDGRTVVVQPRSERRRTEKRHIIVRTEVGLFGHLSPHLPAEFFQIGITRQQVVPVIRRHKNPSDVLGHAQGGLHFFWGNVFGFTIQNQLRRFRLVSVHSPESGFGMRRVRKGWGIWTSRVMRFGKFLGRRELVADDVSCSAVSSTNEYQDAAEMIGQLHAQGLWMRMRTWRL